MGLLAFFRRSQPTANVAKERLRIIVAQERSARGGPDYFADAASGADGSDPQVHQCRS